MAMSPMATNRRMRTSRSISRCSGERRRSRPPSAAEMRPNSVVRPVATTTPSPRPLTTAVPAYAREWQSASAAPAGSGSVEAASGSDSPVRTLLSTDSASDRTRRRSAGTTSPTRSSTRSPGTRSRVGTSSTRPPRRTRADGAAASRKASSAFSPRYSVITLDPTIGARMTSTSSPSRTSLRAIARQPAMNSRTMNGSRAPSQMSRSKDVLRTTSSSFGPNLARRAEVCSDVRPIAGSDSSCRRTASEDICAAETGNSKGIGEADAPGWAARLMATYSTRAGSAARLSLSRASAPTPHLE